MDASRITWFSIANRILQQNDYSVYLNINSIHPPPITYPSLLNQPWDIISPACPGSAPRPPLGETCPEHLTCEAPGRHSGQMPELPQLAPFNAGERQLYSELLPNGQAPHLIPKVELGHPSEEAHWSCWIKTPLEFSEEVWILGFKLLCQIRSFSCFSLPRTCDHRWELGCCTLVNLRSLTWDIPNSHY